MANLHSRTKKYVTYGKKSSRIVDNVPSRLGDQTPKRGATTLPSSPAQRSAKQPLSMYTLLMASAMMSASKTQAKKHSVETISSDSSAPSPIKTTKVARKEKVIAVSSDSEEEEDWTHDPQPLMPLALRSNNTRRIVNKRPSKTALKVFEDAAPKKVAVEPLAKQQIIAKKANLVDDGIDTREAQKPCISLESLASSSRLPLPRSPVPKQRQQRPRKTSQLAHTTIAPPAQDVALPLIVGSSQIKSAPGSELQNDSQPAIAYPSFTRGSNSEALRGLLHRCGQDRPYSFSSFVDRAQTSGLLGDSRQKSDWRKLGEATYSEVYTVEHEGRKIVIKIMPLFQPSPGKSSITTDLPQETTVDAALRELEMTRLLNDTSQQHAFIPLVGAYVVQGNYPSSLLAEWDAYKNREPSKALNYRPSAFLSTQVYLLLCSPYAGEDLELFKLRSWKQAASILWQAAKGLSRAERDWQFEHRDLHWGNILVESIFRPSAYATPGKAVTKWPDSLQPDQSGVKIHIIDFTLSSANDGNAGRIYSPLDEEELFGGDGDYQYEVYRHMRTVVGDAWGSFHPVTNLMASDRSSMLL